MTPPETGPQDPQLFAQALAVLERERPTRRAELLFNVLTYLVWGAIALTVLYGIQVSLFVVSQSNARPIALAALCMYLLLVPVSLLNLGFWSQLRRAASAERRLAPSWKEGVQARFTARREQHRIANLAALGLSVVGSAAWAFGAFGLLVELQRRPINPPLLGTALVLTFFGASSVLLPYMTRGRERLQVIADLRASLLKGEITAYDEVARFDRAMIEADRERSIRAEKGLADKRGYRYQESRAVRDAKQALASTELVDVLTHVARLLAEPPPHDAAGATGDRIRAERIGETGLELGYRVDHDAREIQLISLGREESLRPAAGGERRADDPAYGVNLSRSAQASDQALSAEQRKAVDEIIGKIAEDPGEWKHLASPTTGGQLLLRHPSPSLEVTYSVDDAQKTVNVVHLSAPLPAQRTLFISYSHEDREAFTKVMKYVCQLEAEGLVKIWSDDLIKASELWDDKIRNALDSAQAALLLVSQDFINSEFINQVELPHLLDRAARQSTKIFWVPIRDSTVFRSHKKITEFQSLLKPPTVPLQKLEEEGKSRCDAALLKLYEDLREALVG